MRVQLYIMTDDDNTIGKDMTALNQLLDVKTKGEVSLLNPHLIVSASSVSIDSVNYCFISDFNRFYFIRDKVPMPGGMIELVCEVDALESQANGVRGLTAVIDKQENADTHYINDGSYVMSSKDFTKVYTFNSGFNDAGKYILICAGG